MNGYEYICGTAVRFRKKFPNLYERKERKSVFIDSSLLDKIEDIPDAIKAELAKYNCEYIHNIETVHVIEYALEYCQCDEDGEFIEGSDYDFAEEKAE